MELSEDTNLQKENCIKLLKKPIDISGFEFKIEGNKITKELADKLSKKNQGCEQFIKDLENSYSKLVEHYKNRLDEVDVVSKITKSMQEYLKLYVDNNTDIDHSVNEYLKTKKIPKKIQTTIQTISRKASPVKKAKSLVRKQNILKRNEELKANLLKDKNIQSILDNSWKISLQKMLLPEDKVEIDTLNNSLFLVYLYLVRQHYNYLPGSNFHWIKDLYQAKYTYKVLIHKFLQKQQHLIQMLYSQLHVYVQI